MGSATIIANIESPSPNSEIAARLLDVSPEGTESLVARGVYRPAGGSQEMVFQLHPQGYHFAAGHVAKLELLPSDFPYGRFSNLQANVTVCDLELRLPVTGPAGLARWSGPDARSRRSSRPATRWRPNSRPNRRRRHRRRTTPAAPSPPAPVVKIGFGGLAGKLTANGKASHRPDAAAAAKEPARARLTFSVKQKGKKARTVARAGQLLARRGHEHRTSEPAAHQGGSQAVKNLIEAASHRRTLSGRSSLNDSGRPTSLTSKRAVQLPRGN